MALRVASARDIGEGPRYTAGILMTPNAPASTWGRVISGIHDPSGTARLADIAASRASHQTLPSTAPRGHDVPDLRDQLAQA